MRTLIFTAAIVLSLSAYAVPMQSQSDHNTSMGSGGKQPPEIAPPLVSPESALAREALEQGHWADAYRHALQVMTQRIQDVDALGTLAVSASVLGEQTMRDAALNKLLEVEAEPRYYYPLALGVADLAAKKTQDATQQFNAVLAHMPGDFLALYLRGQAYEQAGRPAEALRDYQVALKARPDFSPALATAAQLQSGSGAHKVAIELIERAVALEPANQAFRKVSVQIYARAGLKDKARQSSQELLKGMPGAREAQLFVTWGLLRAGQPAEAQKKVAEITRLFGPQPVDHLIRAMAAADLRQYPEVLRQVTEYVRLKGKDLEALSAASLVYISLGDGKGAVRLFQAAHADRPDDPRVCINLAIAQQLASQPDKARALLDRARATGGSPDLLAYMSANLDLAQGDLAAYRASLAKADGLLPGLTSLSTAGEERLAADKRAVLAGWRNAAMLMLLNGWSIPMERMADRVLGISPTDAVALQLKGLALKATGRSAQASNFLRRATQLEPRFLSAQLALADTLLAVKQISEARTVLATAQPLAHSGPALFQLGMLQRSAGNGGQGQVLLRQALGTTDQGSWRQEAERALAGNKGK